MSQSDDHVQHTWTLTRPGHEPISIDLWIDGETVRVDGGDDESAEGGRPMIDRLLAKYAAAGYRVERDYPVNDPAVVVGSADEADLRPDLESRPDACPLCGSTDFEYVPDHVTDLREGEAWLCQGPSCAWGTYVTA